MNNSSGIGCIRAPGPDPSIVHRVVVGRVGDFSNGQSPTRQGYQRRPLCTGVIGIRQDERCIDVLCFEFIVGTREERGFYGLIEGSELRIVKSVFSREV